MEGLDLYARTARRRWWIPLLFAAVSVGVAAVVTAGETPVYLSAATAAVVPSDELEDASDVMRGLETLERRTVVATFAMVAEARETRSAAADALGVTMADLRGYRVDASVVPSTNIIRITVEGPEPEASSELANALIRVTEAEARNMYRIFGMRPLQAATPGHAPIRPQPARNYTVAAIFGLFLGVVAALALEYLWPSRARRAAAVTDTKRTKTAAAR